MSRTLAEHLEYISDDQRISLFRRAVASVVRPGDVAVDLGCGFAPLGLMCLCAGAARVYGIDRTDAIEIARETADRAGFGSEFTAVPEESFRVELPERADIIICDHIGYFGIDYGVIETVADARRRFLKPQGTIIPARISLEVAGVTSVSCSEKARQWGSAKIPRQFRWLEELGLNSQYHQAFEPGEIATTVEQSAEISLQEASPESLRCAATLRALRDASLDGLGGWFSAMLSPGVRMTNSPLADDAISRDQIFFPFAGGLNVRRDDSVRVEINAHHSSGIYAWKARNLRSGQKCSQTNWRSRIVRRGELVPPENRIARLGPLGAVELALRELIDGHRTTGEIADIIVRKYPNLLPSEAALRNFVRDTLSRLAK